ncbi:hypothetical protein [Streptomyces sp. ISL-100]|uniref:hypothetical protein n=1 Tax=Streptomyces sp. ISL-100 TaxID=2819173 RepID=UPI001BE80E03|nr:hypothetical protein [Streptomyces sp. ISL-100]MBT2401163.1 hypothetical protein [Streptomyces sp. ISL-100]
MPTECPLARDMAELLEGIIADHQSHLGRHLGEEGSHIRRHRCIAFLFEQTALTDDLLRRLPPTTSVSTPEDRHASPLTCDFKLAEAQCLAAQRAVLSTLTISSHNPGRMR